MHDGIRNEYFAWLSSIVWDSGYSGRASFTKLLYHLHKTRFKVIIPRDKNRAEDGRKLRYRYALKLVGYDGPTEEITDALVGPCSVLEMLIALSIHCEEIAEDPLVGDRTSHWFWGMINNLGLGSMYDDNFDRTRVTEALARFMNREYEPDGTGGLFTIRNCNEDLRDVEIWYQLNWYLNGVM